jgi:multiple sugar transport system permease protein
MSKRQFFYAFMVPTFLILFALAFYPLFTAIRISLQNWDLRNSRPISFVGLANYIEMFKDYRFLNSLKISLFWLCLTLGGSILVGMLLAPIVHDNAKGALKNLCLFLFIIPAILPRVGAAYMWRLMYSPSIGIINYLLHVVGIGTIRFLETPSIALISIALIDIWQWGFLITALGVIMLEDVSPEIIEAAKLDGVNKVQLYRSIIFPIIFPISLPILFIKTMESLRSFDFIFVLTSGGPGIVTETLDMYAYWQGIGSSGRISYASSMSVSMVIISVVILTIIWNRLEKWHE